MAGADPERLQDDIDLYAADAAEQYADLIDAMAQFGRDFALDAWRSAYDGAMPPERRAAKVTLFCFATLVNDVNELLVRVDRIASGAGAGRAASPMPVVYERLVAVRALTARLRGDLMVINRARNRVAHAYGRLSADDAHDVIRLYVDRVHGDLWRRLQRWLQDRGHRLA